MRLLETMVQRQEPAWSVKELAASLGVPQTRLYHHVDLLLQHGLIRPVERRVVSGIIETRYRAAALSFQLDQRLFAGTSPEDREVVHQALVAVFDTARNEVEEALRLGLIDAADSDPDHRRVLLTRGLASLSKERAAELRARLQALADEFGNDTDPDGDSYGIVLAVYPMPPTPETPDE
jgi:DNA-binding transcriptional ArsR family regulator